MKNKLANIYLSNTSAKALGAPPFVSLGLRRHPATSDVRNTHVVQIFIHTKLHQRSSNIQRLFTRIFAWDTWKFGIIAIRPLELILLKYEVPIEAKNVWPAWWLKFVAQIYVLYLSFSSSNSPIKQTRTVICAYPDIMTFSHHRWRSMTYAATCDVIFPTWSCQIGDWCSQRWDALWGSGRYRIWKPAQILEWRILGRILGLGRQCVWRGELDEVFCNNC